MGEFDTKKALSQLDPTEQLNYYKKRLEEIRDDYFKLLDMIEKLKEDYTVREYHQEKLFSLYDEIYDLKNKVSNLQIQILEEREHTTKLTVDNEKLKIDLAACRRLANVGAGGLEIDAIWAPTRPELKELPMRNTKVRSTEEKSEVTKELEKTIEELDMHIKNMKLQTENRGNIYAAEIEFLKKDRDAWRRYFDKERSELRCQIKILQESLEIEVTSLIQLPNGSPARGPSSTRRPPPGFEQVSRSSRLQKMESRKLGTLSEVVSIKAEYTGKERFWQKELNGMLKHLQLCKELMGDQFPRLPETSYSAAAAINLEDAVARRNQTERSLKLQLGQKNNLITQYHQKCTELEREIDDLCSAKTKIKHENAVKIGKMHEKIKFLKKHYEEEKTRRRFDAEGFQSELNLVKIEVERLKREMAVQSKKLQKKDKENTLPGQSSNKKKS